MRRWPFHPLLFALFPVLFLFAQNVHLVRPAKVALPLVVVLTGTVLCVVLATLALRDPRRGAIVASGLMLLGLSYGHVWRAVAGNSIAGFVWGRDLVLLPAWGLAAAGIVLFSARLKSLDEMTAIANAVGVGLVALVLINTGTALGSKGADPLQSRPGERSEPIPTAGKDGSQRDIYYLIFDRYAGPDVLKRRFDFDNSPFLDFLKDKGFFVADRSVSNYPKTAHSLAASLNMEYVDYLAKDLGADSSDWKPLYKLLIGPKVTRFLQRQGYRYAHIGPWWDPTAHDPTAQVNYHFDKRSEFTRVLLETTLVRPLAKRIGFLRDLDGRQVAHRQIRFQFDSVLDASELEGPTFVFAHFLLPHPPFTFDKDGSYVPEELQARRSLRRNYVGQVEFANRTLQRIVDRLLDVPAERQPIIILQADEGPEPSRRRLGGSLSWKEATAQELRDKFPILNAYYLPGVKATGLYRSITPVNSFRRVFNAYFGTQLKLLPDESYVFGVKTEPYDFQRVTKTLK